MELSGKVGSGCQIYLSEEMQLYHHYFVFWWPLDFRPFQMGQGLAYTTALSEASLHSRVGKLLASEETM